MPTFELISGGHMVRDPDWRPTEDDIAVARENGRPLRAPEVLIKAPHFHPENGAMLKGGTVLTTNPDGSERRTPLRFDEIVPTTVRWNHLTGEVECFVDDVDLVAKYGPLKFRRKSDEPKPQPRPRLPQQHGSGRQEARQDRRQEAKQQAQEAAAPPMPDPEPAVQQRKGR